MEKKHSRFINKPELIVGGTKICGRKALQPELTYEDALSLTNFIRMLWSAFGEPRIIDDGFSYNIFDTKTGISFRAYYASSGPSYGGSLDFFKKPITGELVPEMKQVLIDFEDWLCQHELAENWEIILENNNDLIRYGMRNGELFKERVRNTGI